MALLGPHPPPTRRCQEDIDDVRREVQIMHHLKVRQAAPVLRHTSQAGELGALRWPFAARLPLLRATLPFPQGQQLCTTPAAPAPDPPSLRCHLPPQGHENITYLQGAYEDKQAVHLVMDLCSGGELFDRWAGGSGGGSVVGRGAGCGASGIKCALLGSCRCSAEGQLVSAHAAPNRLPACLPARPRSIVAKGSYSEKDAAALVRDIVRVVAHCHSMGVIHRCVGGQWGGARCQAQGCHCQAQSRHCCPLLRILLLLLVTQQEQQRLGHPATHQGMLTHSMLGPLPRPAPCSDLKPENFLLESKDDGAPIKCTDFGLSVFFKPGQKFKEVVGSGGGRGGGGGAAGCYPAGRDYGWPGCECAAHAGGCRCRSLRQQP